MWALTFLLLFVVQSGLATQCDMNVGPPGPTECVLLEPYNNQYQWATCQMPTSNKKVATNTSVSIAMQLIAGTSV